MGTTIGVVLISYDINKLHTKVKTALEGLGGEVSELFYLFHSGRKWSYSDVNEYMGTLWDYLEY